MGCRTLCACLAPVLGFLVWWDMHMPDWDPFAAAPAATEPRQRAEDASSVDNAGWVASRDQTPYVVAAPSKLVDFSWTANTTCSVTPDDVRAYERDGFVLVKQVLDPSMLDIMQEEAARICEGQLKRRGICQIEQLRWQVNSFRDFMFYSALGCFADKFIRGSGVRIATEALFGAQWNQQNPRFFSYGFHTDTPPGFPGRYHGFVSDTPGVSAWFPFHDLDDQTQGGSLNVLQGYPVENDCRFRDCGGRVLPSRSKKPASYDCTPCASWNPPMRSFTFKKGDVLFFHPDMPHKTQPVIQPGFVRHSFTMRLVDSDAELCSVPMACGDWMGCCRDLRLESGQRIHSHCFPQIYPTVLDHEVAAHYSQTPKHLMGDLAWNDKAHTIPPTLDCTPY